ncbi:hypothetical protein [Salarchaeum sp. JOR-1]|uniref:hypothetical protein n=1 Tax=Salarchaeum sp. JOR-1 TaxID=2599399 RepID=UPI0011982F15|nr:hypothetical protein [Salarchaeum sp. JOR-1]QDX39709.1 hypothetical protein FQU85_01915 [Salarchaeum sp. JOR-1]
MASFAVERPWAYGGLCVLLWVALSVGIETVLFEGAVVGAALTGAVGGLAFAVVTVAVRRARGQ